jgi:hypothetical protein
MFESVANVDASPAAMQMQQRTQKKVQNLQETQKRTTKSAAR